MTSNLQSDPPPLNASDVIEELCKLIEQVAGHHGYDFPTDCFCGKGGFHGSGKYGPTYDQGYRFSRRALEFVQEAVRAKMRPAPETRCDVEYQDRIDTVTELRVLSKTLVFDKDTFKRARAVMSDAAYHIERLAPSVPETTVAHTADVSELRRLAAHYGGYAEKIFRGGAEEIERHRAGSRPKAGDEMPLSRSEKPVAWMSSINPDLVTSNENEVLCWNNPPIPLYRRAEKTGALQLDAADCRTLGIDPAKSGEYHKTSAPPDTSRTRESASSTDSSGGADPFSDLPVEQS